MRFIVSFLLVLLSANLAQADFKYAQEFIKTEMNKINAKLIAEQTLQNSVKNYPITNLQKVSNQVRAKEELELQGLSTSFTYELPAKHQLQNMLLDILRAFYQHSGQILAWCENRECGSSALLANYVFANPRLNGLDDAQSYALLLTNFNPQEQKPIVIAMYGIKRGNGRLFLHLDLIEPLAANLPNLAPNASAMLKILQHFSGQEGFVLPIQINDAFIKSIIGTLELNSTISLEISGKNALLWRTKFEPFSKYLQRISFNLSDEQTIIKLK